ncbi:MAG: leader peptide processing enzyme [Treponema sp.]|jgi:phosphoglycerol transferase MdoB-like AlkP superfamily enzyme|nr:leader peptide processing enzyme [Treponema sp.]
MKKKLNTILFILCATLFNVFVAIVSFIILALLYTNFLRMRLPENYRAWFFNIILLASIAISFVVYRFVVKFLMEKIQIEKYFDPIFVRKHKKPKP